MFEANHGRRLLLTTSLGAGVAACIPRSGRAQSPGKPIKIGILDDMSGPYADDSGPGVVLGARLAIEDATKMFPGLKVEVVSADMLSKPDVGAAIARGWYDQGGVDAIFGIPQSNVALAVTTVAKEKDKVVVLTGASVPDLTGKYCTANHLHWTYDLYSLANGSARSLVELGGNRWFFLTPDYLSGHVGQQISAGVVKQAGGQMVGEAAYPFPGTTDFATFLLQAQASKANVLCVGSGTDAVNAVKQAREFGLPQGGVRMTAIVFAITVAHSAGLAAAQGMVFTEAFYWDLNEGTRAYSARFAAQQRGNAKPSMIQAGAYSAVLHYLKAVAALGVDKAKASGAATIAQMKAMPTDDMVFGPGHVRWDGKFIHPMYVFETKSPAESKAPWDYYKLLKTIPAEQAFQPAAELGCTLLHP